jgi:hypothetical protein
MFGKKVMLQGMNDPEYIYRRILEVRAQEKGGSLLGDDENRLYRRLAKALAEE